MEDRIQHQFTVKAPTYDRSASWVTDPGLLQAYLDACRVPPDASLLDVCCGTGIVGGAFRGRVDHLFGLDVTEAMLGLARQRLDVCRKGSAYALPFDSDSFDIVIGRSSWHLLEFPEKAVAEMYRVARPGAQLLYGHRVPYGPVDAAWMEKIFLKKQPLALRFYREEELTAAIQAAGFGNVSTSDYPQWELIDRWIDTHETPQEAREIIRDLYRTASPEIRKAHPSEVRANGETWDCWRWVIFSAWKPAPQHQYTGEF